MPELLRLYLIFFKIGLVNFGGGYAMLPLLQTELAEKRDWTTPEELADYYALGQCTPGAIAINVSTFIGFKRKGVLGGIVSSLGFVSPAFIIIFLIALFLTNFSSNEYVNYALAGIRVCVVFLIAYALKKLFKNSLKDVFTVILAITVAILAIFVKVIPLFTYVIAGGVLGLLVSFIKEKISLKKIKPKEDKIEENKEELQTLEKPQEEAKDIKIENVTIKKNNESNWYYLFGMIMGLILGILSIPFIFVFKKKKFKDGIFTTAILWLIMFVSTLILLFTKNNIAFRLYFEFFRIGFLAFGGGLATIPFLKELGNTTGWFTEFDVANMIAISESTPGAMGINMSTYVGYVVFNQEFANPFLSFVGSMISTLGLITPSIIVIEIVSIILLKFKNNKYVNWAFYGLRAASVGLILSALFSILQVSIFNQYYNDSGNLLNPLVHLFNVHLDDFKSDFFKTLALYFDELINFKALGVGLVFGICIFKFKKHPIIYIAIAAVVGILLRM